MIQLRLGLGSDLQTNLLHCRLMFGGLTPLFKTLRPLTFVIFGHQIAYCVALIAAPQNKKLYCEVDDKHWDHMGAQGTKVSQAIYYPQVEFQLQPLHTLQTVTTNRKKRHESTSV